MIFTFVNSFNQIPEEIFEGCGLEFEEYYELESGNTRCKTMSPNNRSFEIQNIPESYFPSYIVRLNFIFMQRSDGSGNYQQGNPEHQQVITDVINKLNYIFANLVDPQDTTCYTGSDFVPDTKVSFIVNRVYIRDDYGWNYANDNCISKCPDVTGCDWYLNYRDNQIVADPSIPRGINIYFTEDSAMYMDLVVNQSTTKFNGFGKACSQFPSYTDFTRSSKIHHPDRFVKYWWMKNILPNERPETWEVIRGWYVNSMAHSLAHEIGHSLSLYHDCPHYNIDSCYYSIMHREGGNPRNYLPPSEIGRMHVAMQYSNVRTFIPDDFYNPNPIIIPRQSSQNWDYDMRLYRNFSVLSNADLALNCNLTLPLYGTNTVAGRLTINERLELKNSANLEITSRGSLTATAGSEIFLQSVNSQINYHSYAESRVNICDAIFSGSGSVNGIYLNRHLYSTLSGNNTYKAWNRIYCLNVRIGDNANIKLYPKQELLIEGTFETGLNSTLEINTVCPK